MTLWFLSFSEILPIRSILYLFLIIYDKVTSNRESKTSVKGKNTEYKKKTPITAVLCTNWKKIKVECRHSKKWAI